MGASWTPHKSTGQKLGPYLDTTPQTCSPSFSLKARMQLRKQVPDCFTVTQLLTRGRSLWFRLAITNPNS